MALRSMRELNKPHLADLPARRMIVLRLGGDPAELSEVAFDPLYEALHSLKTVRAEQGRDFQVEPLRARWPADPRTPKEDWVGVWGIPVPDDIAELPPTDPAFPVTLETWEYGTVAQAMHEGAYSEEGPTVARLHEFIEAEGLEIAGPHEEEYLTRPGAVVPKTMIRYPVRRRRQS